jgi:hypothetical protein
MANEEIALEIQGPVVVDLAVPSGPSKIMSPTDLR